VPPTPRRAALAAALGLAILSAPAPAAGGEAPPLYPWPAERAASVPAPESVLGHELGRRIVSHADALRYLDALAAASDRVRLFGYARSHEGRLLAYAVVSSPGNLSRLAELRANVQRLADPASLGEAEAVALVRATPVLVWLAYAVHGDEHSSTEAALAVAYHLASASDARTLRILDEAVVFIDPVQNPDGRERFRASHDQTAGPAPVADPFAAEHDEPWPSGRFNHALFDLNRDWFLLTQPETRGKVAAFLAWRPQIYVDHHEMGSDSSYYFAPPSRPINANVPESTLRWFKVIGEGNARVFDSLGFDYFTEEVFDLFYPGYGDSWPTLSGAAGMTYEEASAAGLAVERKDGSVLTLRDAIRRHVAASLATAETAAAHREGILADFHRTRRADVEDAGGATKAYLVPPEPDPGGVERLARLLAAQGLRVLRSTEPFTSRASPLGDEAAAPRGFPRGTLIAPLAQPGRRLLSALFELDPKLDERTLKEAAERRRLRSDAPFYDITSWSVPLALNLPAFAAAETPRVASEPVRGVGPAAAGAAPPGHPEPPPGLAPWPPPVEAAAPGAGAADAGTPPGPSASGPPRAAYAYLLPPAGNDALAALVALLTRSDLAVQVAGKEFTLAGRPYPAGTAVLKVHRNPGTVHEAVAAAAARHGAGVAAASTGLTEDGIDLGSGAVVPVKAPRVAVGYGEPASPTSAGWLLHTLRERVGLPVVPIRPRALARRADLKRYDVIVLPDGSPGGYRESFGNEGLRSLKAWMEAGGTLVAIKGAAALACDKDVAWTSARRVKRPRPGPLLPEEPARAEPRPGAGAGGGTGPGSGSRGSKDAGADAPGGAPAASGPGTPPAPAAQAAPAQPAAEAGEDGVHPERIPGAILRVHLEPTHPIAFGYGPEAAVLVNSDLALTPSKEGANPAVFAPAARLRLSGFAWKESLDLFAGKPYVIVEDVGHGHLVLFADDPNFRGGWEGLTRMLLNAILLVPAFE
jgi:hypothetical protein